MKNDAHTPETTTRSMTMSHEEWIAEGTRRFGPDMMKWKFVCPACGYVQSVQDYKDAGAPTNAVAFSCVGRWAPGVGTARQAFSAGMPSVKAGPCDYAGGGLLRLNPLTVDGTRYFDFADWEGNAA